MPCKARPGRRSPRTRYAGEVFLTSRDNGVKWRRTTTIWSVRGKNSLSDRSSAPVECIIRSLFDPRLKFRSATPPPCLRRFSF